MSKVKISDCTPGDEVFVEELNQKYEVLNTNGLCQSEAGHSTKFSSSQLVTPVKTEPPKVENPPKKKDKPKVEKVKPEVLPTGENNEQS